MNDYSQMMMLKELYTPEWEELAKEDIENFNNEQKVGDKNES